MACPDLETLVREGPAGHAARCADCAALLEAFSEIDAGQFLPHCGIRFPTNGCTSCCHLGLCLGNKQLIDSKLIRKPGASDLDWLDQLE